MVASHGMLLIVTSHLVGEGIVWITHGWVVWISHGWVVVLVSGGERLLAERVEEEVHVDVEVVVVELVL